MVARPRALSPVTADRGTKPTTRENRAVQRSTAPFCCHPAGEPSFPRRPRPSHAGIDHPGLWLEAHDGGVTLRTTGHIPDSVRSGTPRRNHHLFEKEPGTQRSPPAQKHPGPRLYPNPRQDGPHRQSDRAAHPLVRATCPRRRVPALLPCAASRNRWQHHRGRNVV